MTVWIPFNSALSDLIRAYFLGEGSPSNFRVILCNDASWDESATMADIIASEVPQTNGYSAPILTGGTESYDSVQARSELVYPSFDMSASGGSVQYDDAVVLGGAPSTRNKVIESVDLANDRLTITAHGLSNGDAVMVTADAGGALPSGIDGSILYYAKAITADIIELYLEPALSNKETWASSGSGTLRLRYAEGKPIFYRRFDTTQTITDGGTHPFEVYVNLGGSTADVEAA